MDASLKSFRQYLITIPRRVCVCLCLIFSSVLLWIPSLPASTADVGGAVAGSRKSAVTAVITVVDALNDGSPGTLRHAISQALPGDMIDFAPNVISYGTINLSNGELVIDKDLTIQGPGANMLAVQRVGGMDFRIFSIINGARVDISGLTIANGSAVDDTGTTPEKDDGGGIQVRSAELTLAGCEIYNNSAKGAGGGIDVYAGTLTVYDSTINYNNAFSPGLNGAGGGIFVNSGTTLTITSSTISDNNADNSAAIEIEDSNATLINSTISGNTSTNGGGAINNAAAPSQASSLTLTNCTVAFNRDHGVLTVETGGGVAETKLVNTIFDNNGVNFKTVNAGAIVTSLGHNFDGDGTSGFMDGVNGDIVGDSGTPKFALLGPLADNGGLTATHALLLGSPAIDAGDDSAAPGIDQRDNSRTGPEADGDGDDAAISDIGAFEVLKYLVYSAADTGAGTLRAAITDNNLYGGGLIAFDIPCGGVCTIAPSTPLPVITRNVKIDGFTQPGSRPNSQFFTDDAAILIQLTGANAGLGEGLELQTSHSTIRGLIVNGFTNGIMLRGAGTFLNKINGNYIGTDPAGMNPVPNIFSGINILDGAYSNVIGDQQPFNRNLIGGNSGAGIFIQGVGTRRNFVLGNFIGLASDGVTGLGNTAGANAGFGIIVGYGAENAIISNNFIAFNSGPGIGVFSDISAPAPVYNTIGFNYIYSNQGPGIDLGFDGVTQNDSGDSDSGPNNLQNFPVISSVGSGLITGTINSTPNSIFRIEFFASSTCDPSGHGQGEAVLGALDFANAVVTDASGNASFTFNYTPLTGKPYITATATNNATGDTSEFSACASALPPSPPPAVSQVSVFDDLIIATGTGFTAPVQVLIDGVGFTSPAIAESDGSGVRQSGALTNGMTIAETVLPGKTIQIEIVNSGGARITYSYTQSRSVSSRSLQRRPPILLTSVYFSGTSVTIEGILSGLIPNTEYVVYFFYTPTGDLPPGAKICPDAGNPQTIMLTPPITVKTDNFGNSKPFRQVYPAVPGKGFVNAIAVPAIGAPVKLTSNCLGATDPPGPALFELKVEPDPLDPGNDRLIMLGFGFSEPTVWLNEIEFVDRAIVADAPAFGQQLVQSGRLRDGRSIREVIKPGETIRIRIRNGNGGVTQTQFRR